MANCDPSVLQQASCANSLKGFSDLQLLVVMAQALCAGVSACDPVALLQSACNNGMAGMSDRQLRELIAQQLCQLGGTQPTCIQCSDHDPVDGVDIPPCNCSLWVTNVTNSGVPNLWKSSDGATWQPIIYSP